MRLAGEILPQYQSLFSGISLSRCTGALASLAVQYISKMPLNGNTRAQKNEGEAMMRDAHYNVYIKRAV